MVRYNVSENDRLRVITMMGSQDSKFYNNTIYIPSGSTANVFEVSHAWSDLTLANNLIYNLGSGDYVYTSDQPASKFSWRNNLFYGNHPAGEPTGNGNITADPLLVSPGSGGTGIGLADGYQLSAGSRPSARESSSPTTAARTTGDLPFPRSARPTSAPTSSARPTTRRASRTRTSGSRRARSRRGARGTPHRW